MPCSHSLICAAKRSRRQFYPHRTEACVKGICCIAAAPSLVHSSTGDRLGVMSKPAQEGNGNAICRAEPQSASGRCINDGQLWTPWILQQGGKAGTSSSESGSRSHGHGEGQNDFQRNESSWTALIWQHTKCGRGRQALRLYDEMQKDGVKPSTYTFVALLKACRSLQDLESVKRIHSEVVANGFESDLYMGNMLIGAYAKCRSLVDARCAFETMRYRDVVSWSTMIIGYAQMDKSDEALQLYTRMQQEGVIPSGRTYVGVLKACSMMAESVVENGRCLETVRSIHMDVLKAQLQSDVFVGNTLVDAYVKCGSLADASRVFERMPRRDKISWTAMIFGCAQMGQGDRALELYSQMQMEGVTPDDRAHVSALKACGSLVEAGDKTERDGRPVRERCLEIVRAIHANIRKQKLEANVFVETMVVDVYAKCGNLEDARCVFEKMPHRDVVSWTAMIVGYAQMGKGEEALQLYTQMQTEGVIPDGRTYAGVLNACGSVAGLEKGKDIHAQILKAGAEPLHSSVISSLIDMYGKCGSMVDAQRVFDGMPTREIVVWNALIAGYAHQGDSDVVFDLFARMKQEGVWPNGITFLGLLTVCSHVGLVEKGQDYFEAMSRDCGISPTIKHFTCMVDLLGRLGQLDNAMGLVKVMPFQPDSAVWQSVLSACQKWGEVQLGRQAFDHAMRLNPDDAAAYVSMSNIYAAAHMPAEAKEIQAMRVKLRAWKQPGRSRWTDLRGIAHVFVVGDQGHPESQDIYAKVKDLLLKMKEEGYEPHQRAYCH